MLTAEVSGEHYELPTFGAEDFYSFFKCHNAIVYKPIILCCYGKYSVKSKISPNLVTIEALL